MFIKHINFKSRGFTLTPSFKNKENLVSGFTLIELLVVVAIIGILASVVIASLNNAREKGKIASIKSNLKNMIAQVELSYDIPGNYSNACTDVQKMIDAITGAGGTVGCYSYDNTRWGVSVKLNSDTTKNYSVDSQGVVMWDTSDVSSSTLSWSSANTNCANLGGKLPTVEQLRSLQIAHVGLPPNFKSTDLYWSSITYPTDSMRAYTVNMSTGSVSHGHKTINTFYVRCVR